MHSPQQAIQRFDKTQLHWPSALWWRSHAACPQRSPKVASCFACSAHQLANESNTAPPSKSPIAQRTSQAEKRTAWQAKLRESNVSTFLCESHWLPYCLLAQTIPEGMQNSLLKIKNRGHIIVGNLCTKIHTAMRDTKAPGHLDGKTFPL